MRSIFIVLMSAMISLATANVLRAQAAQNYLEKERASHLKCKTALDAAEERLTEVDCSAPLNPRLPFHGMGLWRALYCPGSQP